MKSYRQTLVPKTLGIIRVRVRVRLMDQLKNSVPRGTKFSGGSVGNFRSPGNGIFQGISWKISFPGERNFSED